MQGNYNPGDLLLIKKFDNFKSEINRGDVIICVFPIIREKMIKRVIGLPLEYLKIDKLGHVFINDKKLEESYVTIRSSELVNRSWQLKKNEFFLLGDNRRESKDCRQYGPIFQSYFIGQVYWKIWPLFSKKTTLNKDNNRQIILKIPLNSNNDD